MSKPIRIEIVVSNYHAAKKVVFGQIERYTVELKTKDEECLILAKTDAKRAVGRAVTVRPNWNDGATSFHEWRSFDGAPFEYVRFEVNSFDQGKRTVDGELDRSHGELDRSHAEK